MLLFYFLVVRLSFVKIGKNLARMKLELIRSKFVDYFFSVVELTSLK
jgi:hypothetical protein